MSYELTADLETGNAVIDQEHRELFDAVNQLMEACTSGKGRTEVEPTVNFLLEYVDRHFRHEETLQEQMSDLDFSAHRVFHQSYQADLRDLARDLSRQPSMADVAKLNHKIAILVTHIRTEDRRMAAYLH